jgi:hypothetical protein
MKPTFDDFDLENQRQPLKERLGELFGDRSKGTSMKKVGNITLESGILQQCFFEVWIDLLELWDHTMTQKIPTVIEVSIREIRDKSKLMLCKKFEKFLFGDLE